MTQLRVAVVGAGPAGSNAARLLAARGAEVTLFEARRLPRPKLCGGGLSPKTQRLVPPEALEAVERRVDRVELRAPHLGAFTLHEPAATIAMVERSTFDLALVEAAGCAGVDVRDGSPVREITESATRVSIRTDRGVIRADAAVVADGEPSRLSRRLGLGGSPRRLALALEVDLPFSPRIEPDTSVLTFGIRGGYGWYFPKGDHANVGIGSYRSGEQHRLRDDLAGLARELGLDARDGHVRGHWIPQGLRVGRLASERIVLAGDAAATVDALFGEGISYAVLSGIVAAQTIGDWSDGGIVSLRDYDRRLRAALAPALDRLGAIAIAAEVSISGALLAVRLSHAVRERAVDMIAGRREPFVIDGRSALACTCEIHTADRTGGRPHVGPGPGNGPTLRAVLGSVRRMRASPDRVADRHVSVPAHPVLASVSGPAPKIAVEP